VISPSQRPLPDNTQHSQETDIQASGGIWIRNPSKRALADPRLRHYIGIPACKHGKTFVLPSNAREMSCLPNRPSAMLHWVRWLVLNPRTPWGFYSIVITLTCPFSNHCFNMTCKGIGFGDSLMHKRMASDHRGRSAVMSECAA
jgi:hypothetical protein